MEKELVIALILGHFTVDWLLQPRTMARRKSSNLKFLAAHLAIVFAGMVAVTALFTDLPYGELMLLNLLNIATHGLIDRFIWPLSEQISGRFTGTGKDTKEYLFYATIAVDQSLHLVILMILFG